EKTSRPPITMAATTHAAIAATTGARRAARRRTARSSAGANEYAETWAARCAARRSSCSSISPIGHSSELLAQMAECPAHMRPDSGHRHVERFGGLGICPAAAVDEPYGLELCRRQRGERADESGFDIGSRVGG